MAGRPLRPATDHSLGGPLPPQLANPPQGPPPAACAFPGGPLCPPPYAVLAPVSRWYPPPRGRSPTCYSPVRHWRPKPPVRLACLRCAASVCPEPGSNSPSQCRKPTAGLPSCSEVRLDLARTYANLTKPGTHPWLDVSRSSAFKEPTAPHSAGGQQIGYRECSPMSRANSRIPQGLRPRGRPTVGTGSRAGRAA